MADPTIVQDLTPTGTPEPVVPPINTPNSSGNISSKPKINRRLIVTMFGIFVLIAGVGAGLFAVSRQTNIKNKAATSSACTGTGVVTCNPSSNTTGQQYIYPCSASIFQNPTDCGNPPQKAQTTVPVNDS